MTIALEANQLYELRPGSSSESTNGCEPGCAGGCWCHRRLVLAALVIPVGLVCVAYLEPSSAPFAIIILGKVGIRKAYRLDVNVDPKINAFLILEKARTGMTVAEIVETVFRDYQRRRSETIDDERRRGREAGIVDPPGA